MDPDVQGVNFKAKWIFPLGPKIQILFEWGEMSGSEAYERINNTRESRERQTEQQRQDNTGRKQLPHGARVRQLSH